MAVSRQVLGALCNDNYAEYSVLKRCVFAGMAHKQMRINKNQANQLGFLPSEAGLAIIYNVLALQHFQNAAVVGGVPHNYWRSLLANVRPLPYVFSELGVSNVQPTVALESGIVFKQLPKQRLSQASLKRSVQQLVMNVLGKEDVDPHQPLAYQGIDSLSGLDLRQQIHVSNTS